MASLDSRVRNPILSTPMESIEIPDDERVYDPVASNAIALQPADGQLSCSTHFVAAPSSARSESSIQHRSGSSRARLQVSCSSKMALRPTSARRRPQLLFAHFQHRRCSNSSLRALISRLPSGYHLLHRQMEFARYVLLAFLCALRSDLIVPLRKSHGGNRSWPPTTPSYPHFRSCRPTH